MLVSRRFGVRHVFLNLETPVRHIFNIVSAGILLGLSLLAVSVLTALYASPWQAATIFATLTGIFASVSLYHGEHSRVRALEVQLAQARTGADALNLLLRQERTVSTALADELDHTKAQLQQCARDSLLDALEMLGVVIVLEEDSDEEPPLFI